MPGDGHRDTLPPFAIVAPALLIPALLGARLYIGMSEARFRQIVLGLLTASGVALLASAPCPACWRAWPDAAGATKARRRPGATA